MRFIVDVTNACDKECLADVTKALITGKSILIESKLETVQNLTWLFTVWHNSIYGNLCTYIMQLLHIYTNELNKWLCKQCISPLKYLFKSTGANLPIVVDDHS